LPGVLVSPGSSPGSSSAGVEQALAAIERLAAASITTNVRFIDIGILRYGVYGV
jgi:hypothetical protein